MNFIKYKWVSFLFSGVLVAGSIIAILLWGLNLGIDFKGGTLMEFVFENPQKVEDITKIFNETPSNLSPIVIPVSPSQFIVRTKDIDNETHSIILKNLEKSLGKFNEARFTTIGPLVGESLKKKALIAVAIASVMIIVYIAFAFRKIPRRMNPWKFGIAAVLALTHDILITVGFFAFFGKFLNVEIDSLFITALLTILGFSVHDTIVVFDRLRENLRYQGRDETFTDVANKSITQTLARSINTSFTTFLTLLCLFLLGGESIKFFILALLIGITIGTYSSICVATPILVIWQKK